MPGITHLYLNIGRIEGGTNTNLVPGKVLPKLDRWLTPEEDPVAVKATIRQLIADAAASHPGISVDIKRTMLARALQPHSGNQPMFGEPIPTSGSPLYADVHLYCEQGMPAVIYGAGPRTVFESDAKRADEHLLGEDLRRATKVVVRSLFDLLS